ncbi:MAG TPA: DUF3048 domain-containing protein [Jatrophihabitans sp.]|jgi:hypothetical protein|uniref:DUF3048 domain-containing protein n=1 Tax=Jatrophihabitans sp. TaxID=1932789 RepID=UPI002F2090D8
MIAGLSKPQALIAAGAAAVVMIGGVSALALRGEDTKLAAPASSSSPASSPVPTPTPTPSAKPSAKPVAPVNPLTGIGKPPAGPVLGVKIDDTANGRPAVGLDKADVVYIEEVEGGLTRMLAVFGTSKPVVEPVRSVRASDAELLVQYGRISLVASGGGHDALPRLDASPIKGIINDRGAPGFSRDGNRPVPYNVRADLARMSARARTAGSRNVGFSWARTDPRLKTARVATSVRTVVGSTPVTFQWQARLGKYVRTIGGAALHTANGAPIATPNVLVQLCRVTNNFGDVDVNGNPSRYTHTVGSGRVVLFRNGHRIEGRWSRPSAAAPTRFTDLKGAPLLLAPGGAYVVLAAKGARV